MNETIINILVTVMVNAAVVWTMLKALKYQTNKDGNDSTTKTIEWRISVDNRLNGLDDDIEKINEDMKNVSDKVSSVRDEQIKFAENLKLIPAVQTSLESLTNTIIGFGKLLAEQGVRQEEFIKRFEEHKHSK